MTHSHGPDPSGRRLAISLVLTLAFIVLEAFAGFRANSLALLSDALHNLVDALALGCSWYALWIGNRPPDARRTYGQHRAGILAALANAVTLVVLALLIFWEAIDRLRAPAPVAAGPMILFALIAVLLNGAISLWLRSGAKDDLNVRSAYLHMLGDAISALGVMIAGWLVLLTGYDVMDPLVSLLIGAFILWSSWAVLKESVNVIMEATPLGFDMTALAENVRSVPGVCGMHDLHVWTIGSGIVACSCHIVVTDQSVREGQQVLRAVGKILNDRFGVSHHTIQVEVEGCHPDDLYCILRRMGSEEHGHGHGA